MTPSKPSKAPITTARPTVARPIGKPMSVAEEVKKLQPFKGGSSIRHPGDADALPKMHTPKDH